MRGDTTEKRIALVFTGDEFGDGADMIAKTLKAENVKASFFLTGNFYANPKFATAVKRLRTEGHYLGAHSDKHLLYCDWSKRDSLLVTRQQFENDLKENYRKMKKFGIEESEARFFLPPYEWYNDSISRWTLELGLQLVNFTPGTLSTADYTTPDLKNYRSSDTIYRSIQNFEGAKSKGLNGFILLLHIGTDPKRTDKFYKRLPALLKELKLKGYEFERIDKLLN